MKILYKTLMLATIIGIICFSSSCKDAPDKPVEKIEDNQFEEVPLISHSDFKAIWEQIDKLWERRDPELIPTVYAEEFVRVSPSGTSTNIEELTKEFNLITSAYPDMQLNLDDYTIKDNTIVVYWSVDGTFSGELLGVKGNGKPFQDLKGISLFTFKDGKIAKDDSYWNTLELFTQTGYSIMEKK